MTAYKNRIVNERIHAAQDFSEITENIVQAGMPLLSDFFKEKFQPTSTVHVRLDSPKNSLRVVTRSINEDATQKNYKAFFYEPNSTSLKLSCTESERFGFVEAHPFTYNRSTRTVERINAWFNLSVAPVEVVYDAINDLEKCEPSYCVIPNIPAPSGEFDEQFFSTATF